MSISKRRVLLNAFSRQKLIVWLCHNGTNNQKKNRIHYKMLSYEKLLEKDGSASVHERNLLVPATGTFNNNNVLSSTLMNNLT